MFVDLDLPRAPGLGSRIRRTRCGDENVGGGWEWPPTMSRKAIWRGIGELSQFDIQGHVASLDITRAGDPSTHGNIGEAIRMYIRVGGCVSFRRPALLNPHAANFPDPPRHELSLATCGSTLQSWHPRLRTTSAATGSPQQTPDHSPAIMAPTPAIQTPHKSPRKKKKPTRSVSFSLPALPFPLASFLHPLRSSSSQWLVLPVLLMVVLLFRWAVGLGPYSGMAL